MKWRSSIRFIFALGLCTISSCSARAIDPPVAKMKLLPEGAMKSARTHLPRPVALKPDEPAGVTKKPSMEAPLYGQVKFAGKVYVLALDEPEGKDARLYVDSNGNGDLTDDTPADWKQKPIEGPHGEKLIQYTGSFRLPFQAGGTTTLVSMHAYRFDKKDPQRASLKNILFYYCDYAYDGDITIGANTYHTMLMNDLADGDFRGLTTDEDTGAGVRLLIDLNGDGKYDPEAETFDPRKPFNIKGTTWEVADLTTDGQFKLIKSSKTVPEIPVPPALTKGHDALQFTATKMDGSKVNFPGDFKGKLVLLDFWATWCGPCMAEMPEIVKAYNELHPKGLEILAISLDEEDSADRVKKINIEQGMAWPEVYEGKMWDSRIAQLYGIRAIPQQYLVDGDTGKVALDSDALEEDIYAALRTAVDEKFGGKPKAH